MIEAMNYNDLLLDSWAAKEGVNTTEDIISWINERNRSLAVDIKKIPLAQCEGWFYDSKDGTIHNLGRSFFSISGLRKFEDGKVIEQPILLQPEIGYLGILCKPINGILHFLMQAKIEPGNVNCIQISPTIQATKSNFTQKHGGKRPAYLEWFLNAKPERVLVDQIQSEQSSRFLKKRNRNIIVMISGDEAITELSSHKWMTLGQIKALMRLPNIVNMDARTVLSCIPFAFLDAPANTDAPLLKSIFARPNRAAVASIYRHINDLKMFDESSLELVDLYSLSSWKMDKVNFSCEESYPFRVTFCDISIEGREVCHWCQPLFEAMGKANFALLYSDDDGKREFLVKVTKEIGCFDVAEIGPTYQREAVFQCEEDEVSTLVQKKIKTGEGVVFDNLLSEEGGRFYHEENRNLLIECHKDEIHRLPLGYCWCDFATLNALNTVNNTLNIQLRNLLSLLEV